jgi:serine/threonine protein kinase
VYPAGVTYRTAEVNAIARGLAAAGAALHGTGAIHGDMYAHNVLFRSGDAGAVPAAKLGDFGAAFFYPPGSEVGAEFERTEVRAWGIAALEVLDRWDGVGDTDAVTELRSLADVCIGERSGRPSFREIVARVGDPEGV